MSEAYNLEELLREQQHFFSEADQKRERARQARARNKQGRTKVTRHAEPWEQRRAEYLREKFGTVNETQNR